MTKNNNDFADSVAHGLGAAEKNLSSRYFYDSRGGQIFQAIMSSQEYYLTRSETEIFATQAGVITQAFPADADLVELGAGDGTKTEILLREMLATSKSFRYQPIDISSSSLSALCDRLSAELPGVQLLPTAGEYEAASSTLPPQSAPRVFMLLGSNIGNFAPPQAADFLHRIGAYMNAGDRLMIGVDLKKDPRVIRAAYNDSQGLTRDFNLNLLRRINRELGGGFDLETFEHYASYDPDSGACKSFLVSKNKQSVPIQALNRTVDFHAGECIFMEISQKYSRQGLAELASNAGFEVLEHFEDAQQYFCDQIWQLEDQGAGR